MPPVDPHGRGAIDTATSSQGSDRIALVRCETRAACTPGRAKSLTESIADAIENERLGDDALTTVSPSQPVCPT